VRDAFYLSPASLEFAESAEKDDTFFKKSLRGRFFKTAHASGGDLFAKRRDLLDCRPLTGNPKFFSL
jgi:hypothetical protein